MDKKPTGEKKVKRATILSSMLALLGGAGFGGGLAKMSEMFSKMDKVGARSNWRNRRFVPKPVRGYLYHSGRQLISRTPNRRGAKCRKCLNRESDAFCIVLNRYVRKNKMARTCNTFVWR